MDKMRKYSQAGSLKLSAVIAREQLLLGQRIKMIVDFSVF
jgi:hypothetical protein